MDELTLLRRTRSDHEPPQAALDRGRAALLARAGEGIPEPALPRRHPRRARRLTWVGVGAAGVLALTTITGTLTLSATSAHASGLLRETAARASGDVSLTPGQGEYLRSHTHARWPSCTSADDDPQQETCRQNDQVIDVYMPADSGQEWVLYRDWGSQTGVTGSSIETIRSVGGHFYNPDNSWVSVDYDDIPADGAAAYAWIDAQYSGGSASRDEDNFTRITDILRSGLVPSEPRRSLLEALSRVPGVSATNDVANLDGVVGVAIGRNEPFRAGERREIIIDPDTGLVIGERQVAGATVFGWTFDQQMSLTAVETTIVDDAPAGGVEADTLIAKKRTKG